MKLYAQQGYGPGEKTLQGLAEKLIDGVILSPCNLTPTKMGAEIEEIRRSTKNAEIMIDPQFYVSPYAALPNVNLGKLDEWSGYFKNYRLSQLEVNREIDSVLKNYFKAISMFPVNVVIAPNVYISKSLDSREAVIAKNFIRQARNVYGKSQGKRPLYVTLALSCEALKKEENELNEFLNDIAMIDEKPDGFYVVVGSQYNVQSEINQADVIARWMFVNYALSVNGFSVINGYTDLVAPFLAIAGGAGGATGWWANLRLFSMDRFIPEKQGGRLPIVRYLSKRLLNRITYTEKQAFAAMEPSIVNRLPHDKDYNPEPERKLEVLQSWEAIKSLIEDFTAKKAIEENLKILRIAIKRAQASYTKLMNAGVSVDVKSNDEHLEAFNQAIDEFVKLAELRPL